MDTPLPPTEEPAVFNSNYILYWNSVALDLNRLVNTIDGPQNGPPSASRALGILHLAINDAYFAIKPDRTNLATTYLSPSSDDPSLRLPNVGSASDPRLSVAGAANTVLEKLYTTPSPTIARDTTGELSRFLRRAVDSFPNLDTLSSSYRFGIDVGNAILALLEIRPGEPGFGQDSYRPTPGLYRFDDDPTNPVRQQPVDVNDPNGPTRAVRIYNSPFYGISAKRLAVQGTVNGRPTEHIVADPPVGFGTNDIEEYNASFEEIIRLGGLRGLNTTKRTPLQDTIGHFWAYDGSTLIGTPLRFFNQILRKVAWERRPGGPTSDPTSERTNADFARLFAFANAAMADAGIFAWQEKYNFEFWRPLSGVRQDAENPLVDPFWLELGAPATNTNQLSFKPPFPSYVSGHATFVGAGFQAARLYYRKRDNLSFKVDEADNISFEIVSDELNGISRELRQPYDKTRPITDQLGTVRTRVSRRFTSLWQAMFDCAISRVFLGVHWRFDAFSANDVLAAAQPTPAGMTVYKDAASIKYVTLGPRADRPGKMFAIGGVPLGIGIANDIFENNLRPTPTNQQPSGRERSGDGVNGTSHKHPPKGPQLKVQNGTVRLDL